MKAIPITGHSLKGLDMIQNGQTNRPLLRLRSLGTGVEKYLGSTESDSA